MITAIRNQVIILPNERTETVTDAGLVLGTGYNPELGLRRGKIVSVGPNCREVKVGQEACYMAFSGRPLHYEEVRYLTMGEEEVIGVTA
jgi:co-chaperonin GroES (HSP10)